MNNKNIRKKSGSEQYPSSENSDVIFSSVEKNEKKKQY